MEVCPRCGSDAIKVVELNELEKRWLTEEQKKFIEESIKLGYFDADKALKKGLITKEEFENLRRLIENENEERN